MSRILISVPDLSLPGGVSNIYKSITWNKFDRVSYFYNTTPHAFSKIWFIPLMLIRFLRSIKHAQLVQFNPSLDFKAVVRDGILILISKLLKKNVIVFFHGWDERFERAILANRIYNRIFLAVFNKVDVFFLLGTNFKIKLLDLGVVNDKVYYLPTIADNANIFRSVTKDSNRTTLLFISRFVPAKGMDVVLRTFDYLQTKLGRLDFDLIMAGDGPELIKSMQYVQRQKMQNVHFTGFVDGIAKHDCYSKADFLFFPSSYPEGLPCVIMEAMLYGLVVITRPIGGIPDWVKHKVNGWLSESNDPEELAKIIMDFVEDPSMMKKIREINQAIANKKFTPEKFKERLQQIYSSVLDE